MIWFNLKKCGPKINQNVKKQPDWSSFQKIKVDQHYFFYCLLYWNKIFFNTLNLKWPIRWQYCCVPVCLSTTLFHNLQSSWQRYLCEYLVISAIIDHGLSSFFFVFFFVFEFIINAFWFLKHVFISHWIIVGNFEFN